MNSRDVDTLNDLWKLAEGQLRDMHIPGEVTVPASNQSKLCWMRVYNGEFRICVRTADNGTPTPVLECTMLVRMEMVAYYASLHEAALRLSEVIATRLASAIKQFRAALGEKL